MSAFYVGQRVRKVRGLNLGMEFVVVGINPRALEDYSVGVVSDKPVQSFRRGSDAIRIRPPGAVVWSRPADLEPIVPPGLESLAEIHELYEPESVAA